GKRRIDCKNLFREPEKQDVFPAAYMDVLPGFVPAPSPPGRASPAKIAPAILSRRSRKRSLQASRRARQCNPSHDDDASAFMSTATATTSPASSVSVTCPFPTPNT